jgi:hypothetical protein
MGGHAPDNQLWLGLASSNRVKPDRNSQSGEALIDGKLDANPALFG